MFKSSGEQRIGAIETRAIDGKRKLVLIRRDNVEHLIMTGGPVDIVIETGIGQTDTHYGTRLSGHNAQGGEMDGAMSSARLEERLFSNSREKTGGDGLMVDGDE
jgi:hypothetical protein